MQKNFNTNVRNVLMQLRRWKSCREKSRTASNERPSSPKMRKKLADQTKHANESAAKVMSTLSGSRRKLGALSEKRKAKKSQNRVRALDAAKHHRTKMEEKVA